MHSTYRVDIWVFKIKSLESMDSKHVLINVKLLISAKEMPDLSAAGCIYWEKMPAMF